MSEVETSRTGKTDGERPEQFTCDFCGKTVPHVRRIALDLDYDRLQTPHTVQYACDTCSEEKERRRLDSDGG
jgi:ribosomal protein L37AE/L43A